MPFIIRDRSEQRRLRQVERQLRVPSISANESERNKQKKALMVYLARVREEDREAGIKPVLPMPNPPIRLERQP